MTLNLHSVPALFEEYGTPYPHTAELDWPLLEGKWSAEHVAVERRVEGQEQT